MGDEPPIPPRQHTPEAHPPGPFERHPFTPEQARHVALMRAIAQELFISEATVKTHLTHVFAKLEVKDRAAAVAVAYDRGILG